MVEEASWKDQLTGADLIPPSGVSGPPPKMVKLTAIHFGFDDDVFPPNSKPEYKEKEPQNVWSEKIKTGTDTKTAKTTELTEITIEGTPTVKEVANEETEEEEGIEIVTTLSRGDKGFGKKHSREKEVFRRQKMRLKRKNQEGKTSNKATAKKENAVVLRENTTEKSMDKSQKKRKGQTFLKKRSRPLLAKRRRKRQEFTCNQCGELFKTIPALDMHKLQEYC